MISIKLGSGLGGGAFLPFWPNELTGAVSPTGVSYTDDATTG